VKLACPELTRPPALAPASTANLGSTTSSRPKACAPIVALDVTPILRQLRQMELAIVVRRGVPVTKTSGPRLAIFVQKEPSHLLLVRRHARHAQEELLPKNLMMDLANPVHMENSQRRVKLAKFALPVHLQMALATQSVRPALPTSSRKTTRRAARLSLDTTTMAKGSRSPSQLV